MALVLYRPIFWLLVISQTIILFWIGRRLRLRWWPAWLIRSLLITLILYTIFSPRGELLRRPTRPYQVLIVDQSDSVSSSNSELGRAAAQEWQTNRENRVVIAYGSSATPILPGEENWAQIDGRSSDLSAALKMARAMLGDQPAEVILATDGSVASKPEAERQVSALRDVGHDLFVIPLEPEPYSGDAFLRELFHPSGIWEGSPFTAILPVAMPTSGRANLRFSMNETLRSEFEEDLEQGENYLSLPEVAQSEGIMTLAAEVSSEGDPRHENDTVYAALPVFPPPRVLFLAGEEQVTASLVRALERSGLDVDLRGPDTFPPSLEELSAYEVVFLHGVHASELTGAQMLGIKAFVHRLGRGAIFLGGRHSYTLGGYQDSVLEPMLPVAMEPPPREERPPMTFVLVLDKSSSMTHRTASSPPRIALAQEAAMRAVETLRPEDNLGVLTFSGGTSWDVQLRPIGDGLDLREAQDAIGNIFPVGGTRMFTALRSAIEKIQAAQDIRQPHILLLSDGESSDGTPETFVALAREARESEITISAIAFGDEADARLMEDIASVGGGRFFHVLKTEELPAIMVAESQAARAENTQIGNTALLQGEESHPILSGFRMTELPTLAGYNALSSRSEQGAEDVLLSANFEDPILSVWNYGLGRVAAWMGDAGEDWASEWVAWSRLGDLWTQVVRYVLPDPGFGNAQVDIIAGSIETVISVEMRDDRGEPRNFMDPQFRYADSGGDLLALPLPQIGPGLYSLSIPSPDPGAYRGVVVYEDEGNATQIPAPFAVNYPAEWRPIGPDATGAFLDALIDSGRAQEMNLETLSTSTEPLQSDLTTALSSEWLLVLLVLTWPAEVAARRRWLPWQIDSRRGGQA